MQKIVESKQEADELIKQGWVVKHSTAQGQGYSTGKTCCCAFIFLPLALLGKKKDKIEYVMEKPVSEEAKKND